MKTVQQMFEEVCVLASPTVFHEAAVVLQLRLYMDDLNHRDERHLYELVHWDRMREAADQQNALLERIASALERVTVA